MSDERPVVYSYEIAEWDTETGGWRLLYRVDSALDAEVTLALTLVGPGADGVVSPARLLPASGPGPGVYRVLDEATKAVTLWSVTP